MLGTLLEPFGSVGGEDVDVLHGVGLAALWGRCGTHRGNLVLGTYAHLPFVPGDPRCGHDHRAGIGRWWSCILHDGKHPSLRMVIVGLLLLSHAWPTFLFSVFSPLYESLPVTAALLFFPLARPPSTHPLLQVFFSAVSQELPSVLCVLFQPCHAKMGDQ